MKLHKAILTNFFKLSVNTLPGVISSKLCQGLQGRADTALWGSTSLLGCSTTDARKDNSFETTGAN